MPASIGRQHPWTSNFVLNPSPAHHVFSTYALIGVHISYSLMHSAPLAALVLSQAHHEFSKYSLVGAHVDSYSRSAAAKAYDHLLSLGLLAIVDPRCAFSAVAGSLDCLLVFFDAPGFGKACCHLLSLGLVALVDPQVRLIVASWLAG